MRGLALILTGSLSLVALVCACATGPYEGLGPSTQESNATEPPADTTKLPPKTEPTPPASATPKPDAGSASSTSSSSSSGSSGSADAGTTTGACDTSDPLVSLLYALEASEQNPPVPCPCSAGQCCFAGTNCVTSF